RSGLRFSDGSPLRAANFARALGRVLNPAMRSPGAEFFADVKSVTAHGLRLRIELSKPSGDLLTRLALPFACPVPLGFPIDPAGGVADGGFWDVLRSPPRSGQQSRHRTQPLLPRLAASPHRQPRDDRGQQS